MHTPWGRGWRPWSSVDLPSWCPHPSLWPWPIWPATCRTGHFPDRSDGRTVASTRDERGFVSTEMARNSWGVEQAQRPFLLIDSTEFLHAIGQGVREWRDRGIIPRYNAAGPSKFALLLPEGFPDALETGGQPMTDGPATFPTASFIDRRHVLDWFRGD